jgi:ribosome-binding ATPase YchF (GTP1/OBG family)
MLKPESKMATSLSVEDMAGLARGAKAGEGLANAHLSRFLAFDGAHHCIGAFDDLEVEHTKHEFDPLASCRWSQKKSVLRT